jgi:hypothetical protein
MYAMFETVAADNRTLDSSAWSQAVDGVWSGPNIWEDGYADDAGWCESGNIRLSPQ